MFALISLTGCTTMFLRPNISSPMLTKPGDLVVSQNVSRYGQNRSIAYSPVNKVGLVFNDEKMKKNNSWTDIEYTHYEKITQNETEMGLGFYSKYYIIYGAITYLYSEGSIDNLHDVSNGGNSYFHYIADYKKDAVIGSLYVDEVQIPNIFLLDLYVQSQIFGKYSELKFSNLQIINDSTPSELRFLNKKNHLVEIGYNIKCGLKNFKLSTQFSMGFSERRVPIFNYSVGAEFTGDIYSIFKKK